MPPHESYLSPHSLAEIEQKQFVASPEGAELIYLCYDRTRIRLTAAKKIIFALYRSNTAYLKTAISESADSRIVILPVPHFETLTFVHLHSTDRVLTIVDFPTPLFRS